MLYIATWNKWCILDHRENVRSNLYGLFFGSGFSSGSHCISCMDHVCHIFRIECREYIIEIASVNHSALSEFWEVRHQDVVFCDFIIHILNWKLFEIRNIHFIYLWHLEQLFESITILQLTFFSPLSTPCKNFIFACLNRGNLYLAKWK